MHAIVGALATRASTPTRVWWENYVKGVRFHGVPMQGIRECVQSTASELRLQSRLDSNGQLDLAVELLCRELAEERLAGVLYLQQHILKKANGGVFSGDLHWQDVLNAFPPVFEKGALADWHTVDWFSVKVVTHIIRAAGEPAARHVASWQHAPNLWQRRSACVSFVYLAKDGESNFDGFIELVSGVARTCVRCPERFAQTGVGWLLRELSLANCTTVVDLISEEASFFSVEGVRYATKKMNAQKQRHLLSLVREAGVISAPETEVCANNEAHIPKGKKRLRN